jgi:hypothetical protein
MNRIRIYSLRGEPQRDVVMDADELLTATTLTRCGREPNGRRQELVRDLRGRRSGRFCRTRTLSAAIPG